MLNFIKVRESLFLLRKNEMVNLEPKCLSLKNVTTSRDVWDALGVIYIETVKEASSQHRFYFDVHKVCPGKGVKLHSVGGKHSFFQ